MIVSWEIRGKFIVFDWGEVNEFWFELLKVGLKIWGFENVGMIECSIVKWNNMNFLKMFLSISDKLFFCKVKYLFCIEFG